MSELELHDQATSFIDEMFTDIGKVISRGGELGHFVTLGEAVAIVGIMAQQNATAALNNIDLELQTKRENDEKVHNEAQRAINAMMQRSSASIDGLVLQSEKANGHG